MCKRESWQARQQLSHRGDGNFSRSLQHAPPVVDQSVVCSCASVSQCKHVSHFHIGEMGTFEGRCSTHRLKLTERLQLCKRESRQVRERFPHRGVGKFAGVHIPGRTKIDPKSRFGHVSKAPMGAMRNFRSLRHVHIRGTIVDQSVTGASAAFVQARHKASVSAFFP